MKNGWLPRFSTVRRASESFAFREFFTMAHDILAWVEQLRARGRAHGESISVTAWGRTRTLSAFDLGPDTFVVEDELRRSGIETKSPIIIARKEALRPGASGMLFSLTSGHHGVISVPLLNGKLWDLAEAPSEKRSDILRSELLCGNSLGANIELAQRETPTDLVVAADNWLLEKGWALDEVVLTDRVDETLDHYRRLGQEWRIKPLAWTREEMIAALRSNLTSIHTSLKYYHSVKGIHFLSFQKFADLLGMFDASYDDFMAALEELVGTPEDSVSSYMRTEKCYGHHEIELFGLRTGVAEALILPELENLLDDLLHRRLSRHQARKALQSVIEALRNALIDRDLADERSDKFIATMYRHLTGEVYQGSPYEVGPAFDDRKTALPGATFKNGIAQVHPGTDIRSLAILDYTQSILSHGELIEYMNIYEIRGASHSQLGRGQTREIVFKTNHRPLPKFMIEKRLAHKSTGYGNYTLARVLGFQALGISYGPHHLLARSDGKIGDVHYYIRERYPGEPYGTIPRSRFLPLHGKSDSLMLREDVEVIVMLAALLGEAAAENLILKKYLPDERGNRFGVGKEIIEFGYDIRRGREMPMKVRLCSVRGTLGWEDVSETEENLRRIFDFFLGSFADTLYKYYRRHSASVSLDEVAGAFFEGFASKTREICWNYTCRREPFDEFDPGIEYNFRPKWKFALWALQEQRARLDEIQEIFLEKLRAIAAEDPSESAGETEAAKP